jgi:hypothetical protein
MEIKLAMNANPIQMAATNQMFSCISKLLPGAKIFPDYGRAGILPAHLFFSGTAARRPSQVEVISPDASGRFSHDGTANSIADANFATGMETWQCKMDAVILSRLFGK